MNNGSNGDESLSLNQLAKYFANQLIGFWRKINTRIDNLLVIPVPSHKNRIKERGYCQTSLIAMQFAQSLDLRFSNDLVIRNKETVFMNKMNNIEDRKRNIKEAFKLKENIKERGNILIIDDILTSGSTICELARVIKEKYFYVNLAGLTVASGDKFLQ